MGGGYGRGKQPNRRRLFPGREELLLVLRDRFAGTEHELVSCLVFPQRRGIPRCIMRRPSTRRPGARTWREDARQGIHSGKKDRGESLRARSLL
jgi:hypothetical protein